MGDFAWNTGESGKTFFILESGTAVVVQANGTAIELSAGACFGELALINSAPRSATISTVDEVCTYLPWNGADDTVVYSSNRNSMIFTITSESV